MKITRESRKSVHQSFAPLLTHPYDEPFRIELSDKEVAVLRVWARNHGRRVSVITMMPWEIDATAPWMPAHEIRGSGDNPRWRMVTIRGATGITDGLGTQVAKITPGEWALMLDARRNQEYVKQGLKTLAFGSHIIAKSITVMGEIRVYRHSSLIPMSSVQQMYKGIPMHPLYNVAVGDTFDIGPDCVSDHCTVDIDFLTGEGTGVITWKYDPAVTFERVDEKTLRRLT